MAQFLCFGQFSIDVNGIILKTIWLSGHTDAYLYLLPSKVIFTNIHNYQFQRLRFRSFLRYKLVTYLLLSAEPLNHPNWSPSVRYSFAIDTMKQTSVLCKSCQWVIKTARSCSRLSCLCLLPHYVGTSKMSTQISQNLIRM